MDSKNTFVNKSFSFVGILVGFSGFSALIQETVWLKQLSYVFGSSSYAAVMVLSVFLFGISVGASSFVYILKKIINIRWLPVITELSIALSGVWYLLLYLIFFQVGGSALFLSMGLAGTFFKSILAMFMIFPASFFMGLSFPAFVQTFAGMNSFGRRSSLLYGINTAGAVAGTLAAGFWLMPLMGLQATLIVAICM